MLACLPRLTPIFAQINQPQAALRAKESGSTRFCMGAAWRGPTQVGKNQFGRVLEMVRCATALRHRGGEVRVPLAGCPAWAGTGRLHSAINATNIVRMLPCPIGRTRFHSAR